MPLISLLILFNLVYSPYVTAATDDPSLSLYSELVNSKDYVQLHQHFCRKASCREDPNIKVCDARMCCSPCSCARNCSLYGNCCPDFINRSPEIILSHSKIFTCSYAQFLPVEAVERPVAKQYWFVNKCAVNYTEKDGIVRCEEEKGEDPSLDLQVPVFDPSSNIFYLNRYCSKCNFIPDQNVLSFQSHVQCRESVLFAKTEKELFDAVRDSTDCNVVYTVPEAVNFRLNECQSYTISECNTTGLWTSYNRSLDNLCHAYTSVYRETFRNVFCYMCNYDFTPSSCCSHIEVMAFVSFSALIDFSSTVSAVHEQAPKTEHDCPDDFIYDTFTASCLQKTCSKTRKLVNGTCQAAYTNVFGLCYQAFIKFTTTYGNSSLDFELIGNELTAYVHHFINVQHKTKGISFIKLGVLAERSLNISDKEETNAEEDESSHKHLSDSDDDGYNLRSEYLVYLAISVSMKVYVNTASFEDTILELHDSNYTLVLEHQVILFNVRLVTFVSQSEDSTFMSEDGQTMDLVLEIKFDGICDVDGGYISIVPTTNCVLVVLTKETFKWTSKNNILYIEELDLSVIPEWFIDYESSVAVCEDLYLPRAKEHAEKKATEHISPREEIHDTNVDKIQSTPIGYFSFACTVVSFACLCFTIFTYLALPALRTQPGVNNLVLALLMVLAQVLFAFGLGLNEDVSELACTVIGLLIHFLWLLVLFWMNVCSVCMYMSFRKLQHVNTGSCKGKRLLKYFIYCFLGSSSFVIVNIIFSLVQQENGQIGYGGDLCYISNSLMIGVTFALPVAIIVCTNLTLFLIVVIHIARTPVVQSSTKITRNYFKIYGRLSTLTGVTWIFGFLFMFTHSKIIEYFFVFFNAGQGVFIMTAFACNTRVLRLYNGWCRQGKSPQTKGTNTSLSKSPRQKTDSTRV